LRKTGRESGGNKGVILHQNNPTQEARNERLVRSAHCHPARDRRELGGVRLASSIPLKTASLMMANPSDEELLARNMIDVHGAEAAALARANARGAALAGQPTRAKSWIRVLGIIQRQPPDGPRGPGRVPGMCHTL